MEKIIVRGGNRLEGTVKVEGAKNAVLPILAATLLASEGQSVLTNVPILSDVFTMNNVLKHLNVGVEFQEKNNTILADASNDINFEAPFAYVSKIDRKSVV